MADNKINPEIIAAIAAAVQTMTGGAGKVVAVKIKTSPMWALINRIER